MNPMPLSARQQAAVDALIRAGRLRTVSVDVAKAARFLVSASTGLQDLSAAALSDRSTHRLAYDAAHDCAEALLAAYGYTTANGPGAHQGLAAAVAAILDAPPPVAAAAAQVDSLRQKRNSDHYKAEIITSSEAARAVEIARTLFAATQTRLPDRV